MPFTERLTELLNDKNISRRQLSIQSGIPATTINNWYNRESLPTLDIAEKLADYFECSIDYLCGREEEDGRVIISNNVDILTDIEHHILDTFNELNRRNKIKAIAYIDGLYAGQQGEE